VLTASLPARAQKRGSIEVGAFAAYLNADNSLPIGNAVGIGARAGVNLMPYLLARGRHRTRIEKRRHVQPIHVCSSTTPPVSRAELFFGVGYVRNSYTGSYKADDSGVGGEFGLRHRVTNMVAIRLDGHADFIAERRQPLVPGQLQRQLGNWTRRECVTESLNATVSARTPRVLLGRSRSRYGFAGRSELKMSAMTSHFHRSAAVESPRTFHVFDGRPSRRGCKCHLIGTPHIREIGAAVNLDRRCREVTEGGNAAINARIAARPCTTPWFGA